MAHWQGNLFDTTPLKNTTHGGDDLTVSELSTTPQFRWMGDVGDDGPSPSSHSHSGSRSGVLATQEYSTEGFSLENPVDESFQGHQGETSALDDEEGEGDQTQLNLETIATANADAKDRELESLTYTLKKMNQGIVRLNDVLRSTIPKFQRMQNAINAWDTISKDYNQILYETERTAQVLEDPSWPGRDVEETRYRQMKAAEADRKREEERRQEIEMRLREEARLERERKEKEEAERKAKEGSVRGRGRGSVRGAGVPTRIGRGSTSTRGLVRGSGIGRGSASSHRPTTSVSSIPGSLRGRYS